MQSSSSKKQSQTQKNPLEKLLEAPLGAVGGVVNTATEQVLGFTPGPKSGELMTRGNSSGSINIGERMQQREVPAQKPAENRVFFEKQKQESLRVASTSKNELVQKVRELMAELQQLVLATGNVAESVKTASLQAPVDPGEYHVGVFKHLINLIKSFRKNASSALTWLNESNSRAKKKNFWNRYKSKKGGGSQFLLSSEHYLTRSAG